MSIGSRDLHYAQMAVKQAKRSRWRSYRIGAVLVLGGGRRRTAQGHNRLRCTYEGAALTSLHAERDAMIDALRAGGSANRSLRRAVAIGRASHDAHNLHQVGSRRHRRTLSKRAVHRATLYVVRVNRLNEARNARPCAECLELLRALGVARVVYSDENGTLCSEYVKEMESSHLSWTQKCVRKINSEG